MMTDIVLSIVMVASLAAVPTVIAYGWLCAVLEAAARIEAALQKDAH